MQDAFSKTPVSFRTGFPQYSDKPSVPPIAAIYSVIIDVMKHFPSSTDFERYRKVIRMSGRERQ